MTMTEEIVVNYKHDAHGKPMRAHVHCPSERLTTAMPIALVFHLGGFIVGSASAVPRRQIRYLLDSGFVVVIPNYRLCPQVVAAQSLEDCEDAYEYVVRVLPPIVRQRAGVTVDPSKVVAMGHSIGGTMALHLASRKLIKAVTAFYPSLFLSDTSTSAHKPEPSTGTIPSFHPSEHDWKSIQPESKQVSEAELAIPGSPLDTRNSWLAHVLSTGRWTSTVQPDGDFAAIDPLTRLNSGWPPVMIVQGENDDVPGSSLELARRAEREIRDAGNENVILRLVPGQGHAFDLASEAFGSGDIRWTAVAKGIDWLTRHRGALKTTGARRVQVPNIDVHIRYV